MADMTPFSVRVVNPLERPTSNDFNLAQTAARGAAQALAAATFLPATGPTTGFVDQGFRVEPYGSLTSQRLVIKAGIGFRRTNSVRFTNEGGIAGVDDISGIHATPIVCSKDFIISHAYVPPPSYGYGRVDGLFVREIPVKLTDYTSTDIFNPTAQTFAPDSKPKQLDFDIYDDSLFSEDIEIIEEGQPVADDVNVVYVKGASTFAWTGNASFNGQQPPAGPSGFVSIAAFNRSFSDQIDWDRIRDTRLLLFPSGQTTCAMTFKGGNVTFTEVGGYAEVIRERGLNGARFPPALMRLSQTGDRRNAYRIVIPVAQGSNINAFATTSLAEAIPRPAGDTNLFLGLNFSTVCSRESLTSQNVSDLMNPAITANPPAESPAVGQAVFFCDVYFSVLQYDQTANRIDQYVAASAFGRENDGALRQTLTVNTNIQIGY